MYAYIRSTTTSDGNPPAASRPIGYPDHVHGAPAEKTQNAVRPARLVPVTGLLLLLLLLLLLHSTPYIVCTVT